MDFKYCKLEIFLPPSHLEVLQKALQEVDAGHIGNYDSCMSVSPVTGYWRPLDGCNPYIGMNGEISCEPELKVEVTVYTENVDKTIEVVKSVHPYEEPVINVIPLLEDKLLIMDIIERDIYALGLPLAMELKHGRLLRKPNKRQKHSESLSL